MNGGERNALQLQALGHGTRASQPAEWALKYLLLLAQHLPQF